MWLPRFLSEDRMREVRRLVILDWLLSGTGRALDQRTPTTCPRWTGRRPGRSWRPSAPALREALRRAVQECYGAAAPTPGTLAEDAAHDRVLVSLDRGFSPAAPVGADLAAAFGNLVDQAFTATYPGHPRFEPADVEVTVRDLAAVYAHVERAVADPEGRVELEGDIAAVRRVANALQVGTAGETHFLFGDDRFGPWGAEFERAAARDGLQPQDPVTVGQIRGWIDAMRPELGLRDEVADLVMLAWAALRQRAWYQHGASIPAPRPGTTRPDMELRPEPLPVPGRLADSDVARRVPVRDPGQPVPHRGGRGRVHREPPQSRGRAGRPGRCARRRGWSWPTGTLACPPTARAGWRPPAPGPRWWRPCAGPAAGSTWSRPWPGPRCRPRTRRSRIR